MHLINYSLAIIISFLGLLAGFALCHIAKEEIPSVKKYLNYLNIILIVLVIFLATCRINGVAAAALSLLASIFIFFNKERLNYTAISIVLGFFFALSYFTDQTITISILAFLYSMSLGTLEYHGSTADIKKRKKLQSRRNLMMRIVAKHSVFIIAAFVAFAILNIFS